MRQQLILTQGLSTHYILPMFASMAGIYLHIPFCRKACHYCNFHFSTSFQTREEVIQAMQKEISLQKEYLGKQTIESIYFGGGTPSALPPADLTTLLETIRTNFEVDSKAEVTLEANPDDITPENLEAWKTSGINRLSIGIQAFQVKLLVDWNRSHNAKQASTAIALAQESGFENITADLIYGAPNLSDEDWKINIRQLVETGIPHISCYALTVEPATALAYQIKKGVTREPDDEQANRQYSILQSALKGAGFLQYEVSNFAKPGFESRHNKNYWTGAHYLGIGPAAHSFNGVSRQWNIANNVKYVRALYQNEIPFEQEELTPAQQYNELVMTGLRSSMGIDPGQVAALGEDFEKYLQKEIQSCVEQGKIGQDEKGNWVLHPEFYFFADGIAAELFKVD